MATVTGRAEARGPLRESGGLSRRYRHIKIVQVRNAIFDVARVARVRADNQ